tara:strand:+ start:69 stop:278 length:210 start_codon:yes stop_codon:yes gene_type:complete
MTTKATLWVGIVVCKVDKAPKHKSAPDCQNGELGAAKRWCAKSAIGDALPHRMNTPMAACDLGRIQPKR